MQSHEIPQELLKKLTCPRCRRAGLQMAKDGQDLSCSACEKRFPVREGRFPDFLSDAERSGLEKEIEFWRAHSADGHVAYTDESESSYLKWAATMGASPDDEAIELGCGSGALLNRLNVRLKVGLEPALALLTPSSGFLGVIGVAENLPFSDDSFDLVFFKHSLHHVIEKKKAFSEAVRILRAGGALVIMEPNAEHPQRRLISKPNGFFRKSRILARVVGPVETFQKAEELAVWGKEAGLHLERLEYAQSDYDRLTVRQCLQRIYAFVLRPVLPIKLLFPNYVLKFRKPA